MSEKWWKKDDEPSKAPVSGKWNNVRVAVAEGRWETRVGKEWKLLSELTAEDREKIAEQYRPRAKPKGTA